MITTRLPVGRDRRLVEVALLHAVAPRQVLHRLVDAGELAPGNREVAPRGGAAREHDRVELLQVADGHVLADVRVRLELRALRLHLRDAAVEVTLLHLELGDAVAQQAADAVGPLEHGDVVTGAASAAARRRARRARCRRLRPACPSCGRRRTGRTKPSSHARSTISTSICLIVTAGSLIPSTHAASHGAGHSRPVNSGKLFVACRRSAAASQRSRYTRSFHSGIRFPSGQPVWQNGMPQSMHRAPCVRTFSGGKSS